MGDISALAQECHDTAVRMGFYAETYSKGGAFTGFHEDWRHLWKQTTHLFIELIEAKAERILQSHEGWLKELVDVAIVLMDLCCWLDIDLKITPPNTLGAEYPIIKDEAFTSDYDHMLLAAQGFADTFRKHGADRGILSSYGSALLTLVAREVGDDFEGHVRDKLAINRERGQRYGVAT